MNIGDKHYQSIWIKEDDPNVIQVIDQRHLPFQLVIKDLATPGDVVYAISEMVVRGAPLIGVTASFGIYLSLLNHRDSENYIQKVREDADRIIKSRPTAINLSSAIEVQLKAMKENSDVAAMIRYSFKTASGLLESEKTASKNIGLYGKTIIDKIAVKKEGEPVNILTHCNAGWIAVVDLGTALAPIYKAHDAGIPVHVWVDETRPRNQGARLTAWELGEHGVPHTIITDNAGGHLMQEGMVDMVIVGSDRTALNGDTANKIGTYLKALAAHDNQIPFYVALPVSSIDWSLKEGVHNIPVEERTEDEVHFMEGLNAENRVERVRITPDGSKAANFGFDVTPANYITRLITDRGICRAERAEIQKLIHKGQND